VKIQHLIRGKGVHTILPNDSISYTVDCLKAFHIGSLVVTRNRREIEGIISERDIVQGLPGKFDMMEDLLVRDVMTRHVLTCTGDATVAQVMEMMSTQRVRHVPVVDDAGYLISVVSIGDVVKHYLDEITAENQSLKDYVAGAH
jgi:CBS domain-containing protein